jgi:hypothetical protein
MEDFMKRAGKVSEAISDENKGKVIKTYPLTKDEVKLFNEAVKEGGKAIQDLERAKLKREKVWNDIQLRLGKFQGGHLSINMKTKEIEEIECDGNHESHEDLMARVK